VNINIVAIGMTVISAIFARSLSCDEAPIVLNSGRHDFIQIKIYKSKSWGSLTFDAYTEQMSKLIIDKTEE
jgi:hypothetical protein